MRRDSGGDEQDFVELECPPSGLRDVQVTLVNRVERAAEDAGPSRVAHSSATDTCS